MLTGWSVSDAEIGTGWEEKLSIQHAVQCLHAALHVEKKDARHHSWKPVKTWWNVSTLCLLVLSGCQKQYLESKRWNPLCASSLASRSVNSCIYLTTLKNIFYHFVVWLKLISFFSHYRFAGRPLYPGVPFILEKEVFNIGHFFYLYSAQCHSVTSALIAETSLMQHNITQRKS